jgi:hypothetical protein
MIDECIKKCNAAKYVYNLINQDFRWFNWM